MRRQWLIAAGPILALLLVWRFSTRSTTNETSTSSAATDAPASTSENHLTDGRLAPFSPEVTQPRTPLYRGVVVDCETEQPVPGLAVRAQALEPASGIPDERTLTTNREGAFAFEGLGTYRLRINEPHLVPLIDPYDMVATEEVQRISVLPAGRITGRVEDELGRPVAGASIIAGHVSGAHAPRWLPSLDDLKPNESRPITVTDEEGRYTLPSIPAGCVLSIAARHPDFALARFDGVASRSQAESEVPVLVLHPGASVEIRVMDAARHSIAHARVRLCETPESTDTFGIREAFEATTDTTGAVAFPRVGAASIDVAVDAEGFSPLYLLGRPPPDSPFTLTLEPTHTLSGVVRTARGDPVPGRQVYTYYGGASIWEGRNELAISDAQGRFELRGLGAGPFDVHAERAESAMKVPAGATSVELIAWSGAIRGRIVDAETGAPPSVPVTVVARTAGGFRSPGGSAERRIDESGAFSLDELPPADFQVVASAEGYDHAATDVIHLCPGDVVEGVTIALARSRPVRLTGVVLDADDAQPIPNVRVEIDPWITSRPRACVVTSADGHFAIDVVSRGFRQLCLSAERYRPHDVVLFVRDATELTLTLDRGACVSGRVSRSGVGIEGASVQEAVSDRSEDTDADGSFELSGLPEGPAHLICRFPGGRLQFCEVVLSRERPLVVDFDADAARGGIRGQIRRSGAPEPYASLSLCALVPRDYQVFVFGEGGAFADADGRYAINGLSAGRYRLGARRAASRSSDVALATVDVPDGKTVSCDLDLPDASLEVRVRDENGESMSASVAIQLEARDASGARLEAFSWVENGSGRVNHLAPGRYTVTARAQPFGFFGGEVVVPGEPLEIRLTRHASVRIIVRPRGGVARSGRALLIPTAPGRSPLAVSSFFPTPPGIYDVIVGIVGFPPLRFGLVDLAAGVHRDIEAVLPTEAARLTLELTDPRQSPVDLTVRDASGVDLAPIAGFYPVYTLATGTYSVTAALPDGRRAEASVTLRDGDVTTVRLDPR